MAFPLDLSGLGVTSGIRETAGERKVLMDIRVKSRATMKNVRFLLFAAIGSSVMNITAKIVPTKINGVRFPFLWFILSDHAPNNGSIISANMLSSAIIPPEIVSPMLNEYLRTRGIMLS